MLICLCILAPAAQKIPANAELRHLEDEGFYIGPRPYVTNSNLNRMENRLLKEAGHDRVPTDEEANIGDTGVTIPGVNLVFYQLFVLSKICFADL